MQRPDAETRAGDGGALTDSSAISHGRFAPGTLLAHRYRIVGLLGRGGMGEVYRADDLTLEQSVALKFLPASLAQDPARLAQFHSEVRLARQIAHPNVCRVYDVSASADAPFLSMEYVDGEDLASLLRRIGRLPEDKALELARQLCAGVAAAHDRGVVHRDLKPANVMIDGRGNVRIMDFGLALVAGSATDLRAGTPAYMAPEQLAGREVTPRSDLFAVGLVLFELFTGRRAFEAGTLDELLRLHDADAIKRPTSIVASLDPAIERVILQCLERDPHRRPASALAIAAALPGSDPLAAALAAGETPSPAMVAAAGGADALSSRTAIISLAVIAAMLATLPFLADRQLLLRAIPESKSVEVLLDRAQTIRAALGYANAPRDEAYGIEAAADYLQHIAQTDPSPQRWDRLRTDPFPALIFWYRSSPDDLARLALGLQPDEHDPPLTVPGMTYIATDMQGRLVRFHAVAPERDPDTVLPTPPDWRSLFALAELQLDTFTPVTPAWTPRTFADTRAAWEGPATGAAQTRLRVEAASYRGRPVFFHIVGPWTGVDDEAAPVESMASRLVAMMFSMLFACIVVAAIWMARRHLQRGRADRRGADRVWASVIAMMLAGWALGMHHLADVDAEMSAFAIALALALLVGGMVWLFYLALEPLVRKWHPRALIGWTRALAGHVRDPQVGRDVLVGVAAGCLFAVIRASRVWATAALDIPAGEPVITSYAPLLGVRSMLSLVVQIIPQAVVNGMVVILCLAFTRMIFRRTWAASVAIFAVVITVIAVEMSATPGERVAFALALPAIALVLAVVIRYGLLATIVMFGIGIVLEVFPLTADAGARYFAHSSWLLAATFALALFAAHAARAGQPWMRMDS